MAEQRSASGENKNQSSLAPYRVLDMTEAGFQLCGKLLGDLGADVLKIEPPQGDQTREVGPFFVDNVGKQGSLTWAAFNVNKRGVTLDLTSPEGRDLFLRLVRTADFLLESFEPGELERMGLGYRELVDINPRLLLVSMSWHGQDGPKAHYKGSDLTAWADSGILYTMGDPDRAPTWVSFPQAAAITGAEACAAALIAHWEREASGVGQHVDVSAQDSLIWMLQATLEMWHADQFMYKRAGGMWMTGTGVGRRQIFSCKDGFVAFTVLGGAAEGPVQSTKNMVQWMHQESMAPRWLVEFDWKFGYAVEKLTPELVTHVEEPFCAFFATKTKQELFQGALDRRIILDKVASVEDVLKDPQLRAREYWVDVDYPDFGKMMHCGSFVKLSETPATARFAAPALGQHNEQVYRDELGLAISEIRALQQTGAI